MWFTLLMMLSLAVTLIMVITGLTILFFPKQEDKTHDEVKDTWQWLGFVDLTPNLIRAIVAGKEESGPIVGYISNVRGRIYDKEEKRMRPLLQGENPFENETPFQSFLRVNFGKTWIGLPYLRAVKPIDVDRVVRKDTKDVNGGNSNKLADRLSASKVKRYGLYGEFIRPTYHHSVDTKDQVRFNVVSNAIVVINDPEPGFTIYNDNLLQTISDLVESFFSAHVLKMDWEEYKNLGVGKDTDLGVEKFRDKLGELNNRLIPLGAEVIHLYISDPEISEEAQRMQDALEETRIAMEKAKARKAQGDGEKNYTVTVAEGKAYEIERVAKAKAVRFQELIALYTSNGVAREEAVKMANAMISAEFNAEAVGQLSTYVSGSAGVQLAVPVGDQKK